MPAARIIVFERAAQLGDVALAVGALLGQRRGDPPVVIGLQEAEGQVFQLPLELPEPQAVGERREHLARLERQPLARGGVAILRGIEIDQLPREAREHEARIAHHRQQHLAQRLGLRRLEVVRGGGHGRQPDVAEVREFVRQLAHGRPEMQLDLACFRRAPMQIPPAPSARPRARASSVSAATMTAASTALSIAARGTPQPSSRDACASIECRNSAEQV